MGWTGSGIGLLALAWLATKRNRPGDPVPRAVPVLLPKGILWAVLLLAAYFAFAIAATIPVVALHAWRHGVQSLRAADLPFGPLLLADGAAKIAAFAALLAFLRWRGEVTPISRPVPRGAAAAAGALTGLAFLPVMIGTGLLQQWVYAQLDRKMEPQELVVKAVTGDLGTFALVALFAVTAAPLFEEFAFRGLLHSGIRSSLGPAATALLTAAAFAVYHMQVDVIPVLFLLGLVLSDLRERTGGLAAPIAAHACYNAFTMVLIGSARQGG